METAHPISNGAIPSREDHHCLAHAAFNAACESCVRARAAFLPYPAAAAHAIQPHSTRSFAFNDRMSETSIRYLAESIPQQIRREAILYAEEELVESVIRDLLS